MATFGMIWPAVSGTIPAVRFGRMELALPLGGTFLAVAGAADFEKNGWSCVHPTGPSLHVLHPSRLYFKNLLSGGRKHSWECSALPSSERTFLRPSSHATDRDPLRGRDPLRHLDIGQSPFPRGKLGVSLGAVSSRAPEQGYSTHPIGQDP